MAEANGSQTFGCRWVLKKKKGSDGKISKVKARLVVCQGFSQIESVHYEPDQLYASVMSYNTFRMLLSICCSEELQLHQRDVSQAFVQATLDRALYMRLPEHYKCPGYVLRLIRSLHGTKQAAFLWSQCLRTHLESHGFKRLISDGSVYVKEWTTEVIPGTQSEAQEPQEKPKSGEPVSGSGSQSHQSNSTHDDPDDYRGITKLFSIKSQLQKLVALSTSETETIALCEQITDALSLKLLCEELRFRPESELVPINEDNASSRDMVMNEDKTIDLLHTPTDLMVVDGHAKALEGQSFMKFMEWVTSTSSFDNSSQPVPAQVSERAGEQKSRSSKLVSQSAPVITGSLIDQLRARTVFGGMGTTDTQSTMHVPLASNASSTDAEHRTFQEYCCALLNRSPDTSDGDMDA